jgi:hypothetical protein
VPISITALASATAKFYSFPTDSIKIDYCNSKKLASIVIQNYVKKSQNDDIQAPKNASLI